MSETVHNVTDLPKPTNALKRWSKRAAIVTVVTAVAAAIYVKVNGTDSETVTGTTEN